MPPHGTVTGKFVGADGTSPAVGSAIFLPAPQWILDTTRAQTITPEQVVVALDGTGSLTTSLLATDDTTLNPSGWTWSALILIEGVDPRSFSFTLATNATVDLVTVSPVNSSRGSGIVKGDKGDTGPAGPTGATGPAGPAGSNASATLVHQGTGVAVDNTDPLNPSISASAAGLGAELATTVATREGVPSYVTTQVRGNPFQTSLNAYNLKPSNTRRIRAGLGRATAGEVSEHIVVGDSLSAGCVFGATTPIIFDRAHAWPRMMAKSLGIEDGTGWVRVNDNQLGSPLYWTFSGTWNSSPKFYSLGSSTATATFTVPTGMSGTAFSVMWFDPGAGGTQYPWTISVNGAASGAGFRTTDSDFAAAGWRVTTLLPGTIAAGSTIVLTAGAQGLYLGAAKLWNPAAGGLQVHNLAQSSSRAYSTASGLSDRWASVGTNGLGTMLASGTNGTTVWSKRTITDLVLNGTTTATSATAVFTNDDLGKSIRIPADLVSLKLPIGNVYIAAVNSATSITLSSAALVTASGVTADIGQVPDCLHIELGGNDLSNAISAANIVAAITTIRGFLPNTDVVLHAIPQPANSLIANATYDAYVSALYDLADTLDVPLIDLRARYGLNSDMVTNQLMGDSATHARPALYADWGTNVAAALKR